MENPQRLVKAEVEKVSCVTNEEVRSFLKRLDGSTFMQRFNNRNQKQTRQPRLTDQQRKIRNSLRQLVKWLFDVELDRECTPLFWGVGDSEKFDMKQFYKMANEVVAYSLSDPFISSISDKGLLVREIMTLVQHRRKNIRNSKKPRKDGKPRRRLPTIYEKNITVFVLKGGKMVQLEKPEPLPMNAVPTSESHIKCSTPAPKVKPVEVPSPTPPPKEVINVVHPPSTPQKSNKKSTQPNSRASKLVKKMMRLDNSDSDWSDSDSDFDMLEYMEKLMDKAKKKKSEKDNKALVEVPIVDKPHWIGRMTSGVTTGGAITGTCANASCGKDCLVPLGEEQGLCTSCWEKKKTGLLALSSKTGAKKPGKRKAPKTKKRKGKKVKTTDVNCPGTPDRECGEPLKRTTTPPNPKPKKRKFKVLFDV